MIADLNPYPEYRESGLPWLGSCPSHWSIRRTKILFRERAQKGFPNEPLLAATQTKGVIRKDDYGTRTVTASKDLHLLKLVEVGDYVISLRSFQGGIEVAHRRGIISPAYTVLKPQKDAESGYFSYFFKSDQFIQSLSLFVTGIREGQNIDYSRLSRAELPLPPREEQAAIVRYLGWACGRLDRAIRAKRKIIALLNEQKQAIIHRAVTRGLDPKVPLERSGMSWLPEVPTHWRTVRNLSLFASRVEAGREKLPVLQVSIRAGVTFDETDQFGRPKRLIADVSKYKLVRLHDLAYNTMRMWQGAVGVSPADGLVSPAYVVLQPRAGSNPFFYNYVFRTPLYMDQVNRYSTGIVSDRNRLYWDSFKQMPNVEPPAEEQAAIVDFIGRETASLDGEIGRAEREIALLREYRTRLIADVVTGKLDVREAAMRLPGEETQAAEEDFSSDGEIPDDEVMEQEA